MSLTLSGLALEELEAGARQVEAGVVLEDDDGDAVVVEPVGDAVVVGEKSVILIDIVSTCLHSSWLTPVISCAKSPSHSVDEYDLTMNASLPSLSTT